MFRKLFNFSICIFSLILFYLGYVYFVTNSDHAAITNSINADLLKRRNYIIDVLAKPPNRLTVYDVGMYAMGTYALTNMAMMDTSLAKEHSRIIAQWIDIVLDRKRLNFDEVIWNEHPLDEKVLFSDTGHLGYYGHLNLMMGCYSLLNKDNRYKDLNIQMSDAIVRRMIKYNHRQAETYPNRTFPPDNTVAVASLKVLDMNYGKDHQLLINEWLSQVNQMRDVQNGLIVFEVDSVKGTPIQHARGVNVAWDSFFMPMVNASFSQQEFIRFKQSEFVNIFGFMAFKEYQHGKWFKMDGDSGPVIFGLGGAATVLAIAGARHSHDDHLLTGLLRLINAFGVPIDEGNKRSFTYFPDLGNIIYLAVRTAIPWRVL